MRKGENCDEEKDFALDAGSDDFDLYADGMRKFFQPCTIVLPEDWEYRILSEEDLEKEDNLYSCAIRFWQKDYPEDIFVLGYQAPFGMCGTGVTIDELKLENGITGWRYTEELDSSLWLTIIPILVPHSEYLLDTESITMTFFSMPSRLRAER